MRNVPNSSVAGCGIEVEAIRGPTRMSAAPQMADGCLGKSIAERMVALVSLSAPPPVQPGLQTQVEPPVDVAIVGGPRVDRFSYTAWGLAEGQME